MAFNDYPMPAVRCPACQGKLDGAFGPGGKAPVEGDATICAYCGAISVFTADHGLREVEIETLPDYIQRDLGAARRMMQVVGWQPTRRRVN